MVHFSRLGTLTLIAVGALSVPALCAGGTALHSGSASGLLPSNSSQGYLGVGMHDVDNERASALKLKDPHGAEIVSIDQDAPAAKSGLKVHDVVVQMNGQRVEGIEQFRRMLRECPPGRTVALVAMRDGQPVTLSVQLADRSAIATQIIGGLDADSLPDLGEDTPPTVLPGGRSGHVHGYASGFLGTFTRNRYYVGVDLQPLPTGLADYFGVRGGSGLLVGNVFPNSPASAAGMKAADVIQKVNGQPIVSVSDWDHAIRLHHGKQVQVTVVRDRKEQTLNMVAGVTRTGSELDLPQFNLPDAQKLAELQSQVAAINSSTFANSWKDSLAGIDAEALRQQAEQAARGIDAQQMQKALEQSRRQMEENEKQIDRQMQQLQRQLESMHFDIEEMD